MKRNKSTYIVLSYNFGDLAVNYNHQLEGTRIYSLERELAFRLNIEFLSCFPESRIASPLQLLQYRAFELNSDVNFCLAEWFVFFELPEAIANTLTDPEILKTFRINSGNVLRVTDVGMIKKELNKLVKKALSYPVVDNNRLQFIPLSNKTKDFIIEEFE